MSKEMDEMKEILDNVKSAKHHPSEKGAQKARIDEEKHLAQTMDWNLLYSEIGKRKTTISQIDEDIHNLDRKKDIIRREIAKHERILKWKRSKFKA